MIANELTGEDRKWERGECYHPDVQSGRPRRLPGSDRARIAPEKLTGYLLSATHPVGSAKARFFRGYGFDEQNVDLLERGLLAIAVSGEVAEIVSSQHGSKYVVDGFLQTPTGREALLRTVWIIEHGERDPSFVTAYPV